MATKKDIFGTENETLQEIEKELQKDTHTDVHTDKYKHTRTYRKQKISEFDLLPIKTGIEKETKSKRLNLLVKPSVFEAFREKVTDKGYTVNEAIMKLMESYINEN